MNGNEINDKYIQNIVNQMEVFTATARRLGISEFNISGLSIKLGTEISGIKEQGPIPSTGMPNEDEMLMWSTNETFKEDEAKL